ncbi:MAG TPA: hypothetical protein VEJ84_22560 [Acidimicrobiales bacterium]|nr:hypothetical protein [Acidimicrobiales bacterium]
MSGTGDAYGSDLVFRVTSLMEGWVRIRVQREYPEVDGQVALEFVLAGPSDHSWLEAFYSSPVKYEPRDALAVLVIDPPVVRARTIQWRVPVYLKRNARDYVQQRIDYANGTRMS